MAASSNANETDDTSLGGNSLLTKCGFFSMAVPSAFSVKDGG